MAVLELPVFSWSASKPIAVLETPVSNESALSPRAVLSLESQICGHCAWVSCASAKQTNATKANAGEIRRCNGKRFRFVLCVFIVVPLFCFFFRFIFLSQRYWEKSCAI